MKKLLITCYCIGAILPITCHALATFGCTAETCDTNATNFNSATITGCTSTTNSCYGGYRVYTCTTCNSGYTRTAQSATIRGCANTITYYNCVADSTGDDTECDGTCDDCKSIIESNNSSGFLSPIPTGYQKFTQKTCFIKTCQCTTYDPIYRCDTGYYGTASCQQQSGQFALSCSGCTKCPNDTNAYTDTDLTTPAGTTSNASTNFTKNLPITDCYLPAGDYYDTSGKFTITDDESCYYSE